MAHIDWITASIPYHDYPLTLLPPHDAMQAVTTIAPVPRYETTWILANGATLSRPRRTNKRQKLLFQITGDGLEMNRSLGLDDIGLNRWLVTEVQASYARLDIAYDTDNPLAYPETLYTAWELKQVITHIRTPPKVTMQSPGFTIYFGSDNGERKLRCYDKAAELGLLSEALTRVELQARDSMAKHLAWNIYHNNELNWTGAKFIKDFIHFPDLKWWCDLLNSGGVEIPPLGRKETDWLAYMKRTIIPSIEQHWIQNDNGERDFIDKMLVQLQEDFRKRRKKYVELENQAHNYKKKRGDNG